MGRIVVEEGAERKMMRQDRNKQVRRERRIKRKRGKHMKKLVE